MRSGELQRGICPLMIIGTPPRRTRTRKMKMATTTMMPSLFMADNNGTSNDEEDGNENNDDDEAADEAHNVGDDNPYVTYEDVIDDHGNVIAVCAVDSRYPEDVAPNQNIGFTETMDRNIIKHN
jgi:hypothetical protein